MHLPPLSLLPELRQPRLLLTPQTSSIQGSGLANSQQVTIWKVWKKSFLCKFPPSMSPSAPRAKPPSPGPLWCFLAGRRCCTKCPPGRSGAEKQALEMHSLL